MRVLALDASTKCGWALFVDGKLVESGALAPVSIEDFNVNKDPHLSPLYPYNILDGAEDVARLLWNKVRETRPDVVVLENTNKGKNRHTQRILEYIHFSFTRGFRNHPHMLKYMDTSEWRKIVGLWMSKSDKKNNREVSTGKKRGKITKKHLSVRMVNEKFNKSLKLKDNDEADAILLGLAFSLRSQSTP